MRKNNRDLIAVILIVGINIGWTLLPIHLLPISIVLALPLISILPGYTLTQLLLRKRLPNSDATPANDMLPQTGQKSARPIGNADQLVLSIGLSLVIDVLTGFALNILPIGLQALSWTLALGFFTTLFALVAMLLRRKDVHAEAVKTPGIRIRLSDCILVGMALLVASSALWLSIQRPIVPQPSFTQFWILPANEASKSCDVSIGVQSFEATSVTYRVVMTANNGQTATWSAISLAPESKWVQPVFIEPGTVSNVFVEALLYRVNQPSVVYRNVHLTLHMVAPKDGQVQQECTLGG
jgi:uncharacterized membrane protein